MQVPDPGDPVAIEESLAMPMLRVADGAARCCPMCGATVGLYSFPDHEEWHRKLAAAIFNAGEESRVIASLLKKPVD